MTDTRTKTLGIPFHEQTPESFHAYAKDIAKHINLKRPETKTKTRKKPKNDGTSGPKPSGKRVRKTKKDVEDIQNAGQPDQSGNQFFITIGN